MKRLLFSFGFCLLAHLLICQQIVCPDIATPFSGDGNHGTYIWTIEDRITGVEVNGSVATISGGVDVFGASFLGAQASNVSITFFQKGQFRVRVRRYVSYWPFGPQLNLNSEFPVNVPIPKPIFTFTSPFGDCGATFTLTPALQPFTQLQWFRANNFGILVPIPLVLLEHQ